MKPSLCKQLIVTFEDQQARHVRENQLTKVMYDEPEGKEYQEHEAEVNNEAIRLGFQKEIDVLEA